LGKNQLHNVFYSIIIVILLLSSQKIQNAKANPLPPYEYPKIIVFSPSLGSTNNASSIPLNFGVQVFAYTYQSIERIKLLNYSLDGSQAIPIEPIYPRVLSPGYIINGSSQLNALSDGIHSLVIQGETTYNKLFRKNITFIVDTTKFSISEQSPIPTSPEPQQAFVLFSTLEIVGLVIVVVFALGLIITLTKKRKNPK